MTGFLVVLAVGLVLLALAALRDRQTRLAAERALGAPVSRVEAAPAATPDEGQRAALDRFRQQHQIVDARLADPGMATWADPPTAELADADVLVCSQAPGSLRELLASLERCRPRPLLLVCPPVEPTLLGLVVASPEHRLVVAEADDEALTVVSAVTGATLVDRADLQSGWAVRCHGRLARAVVDADGSWLEK
ncbi:hypothetical protein [Luteococcus peritonei]|uniref:Secreted protein n=1 Tax=Luteococcus peritonei TaxID=88874 RepID=A0ABW4RXH7_9ACTN